MEDKEKQNNPDESFIKLGITFSEYNELKRKADLYDKRELISFEKELEHLKQFLQLHDVINDYNLRLIIYKEKADRLRKENQDLMDQISELKIALEEKETEEAQREFCDSMRSKSWRRSFMESLKRWFDLR